MKRRQPSTDRGQAYTLEGFIGAMAVLLAILLALQAIVITPTTGGTIDRSIQAQQQQELQDALTIAADDGNLSRMIRYWEVNPNWEADPDADTPVFFGEGSSGVHDVEYHPNHFEGDEDWMEDNNKLNFILGEILGERFAEGDGRNYNVELHHLDENDSDSVRLVYQGQPDTNAFTASKMVTLYDDQNLTGEQNTARTLGDVYEEYPDSAPIPNIDDEKDIYNVVEVRVVVW